MQTGGFVPASRADNSGTGPYHPYVEHDGQVLLDPFCRPGVICQGGGALLYPFLMERKAAD